MKSRLPIVAALCALALSSLSAAGIDGRIDPAEYPSTQVLKKDVFTLHWRIEGDSIHLAIEAASRGWVSLGLDPGSVMSNSDMVFGLVGADGVTTAVDAWSTGMFGPHPADTAQGGTSDLIAFAGSRSGDRVVFEFSRKLDTKDKFDKVIQAGATMKVIWATGPRLAFEAKHDKAGSAKLVFEAPR